MFLCEKSRYFPVLLTKQIRCLIPVLSRQTTVSFRPGFHGHFPVIKKRAILWRLKKNVRLSGWRVAIIPYFKSNISVKIFKIPQSRSHYSGNT